MNTVVQLVAAFVHFKAHFWNKMYLYTPAITHTFISQHNKNTNCMLCCCFIHPVQLFNLQANQLTLIPRMMLVEENPKSAICEIVPPTCFSTNCLVCSVLKHFSPTFTKSYDFSKQQLAFTTFSRLSRGWLVSAYQMSISPNKVATEHILLVDSCESFSHTLWFAMC